MPLAARLILAAVLLVQVPTTARVRHALPPAAHRLRGPCRLAVWPTRVLPRRRPPLTLGRARATGGGRGRGRA